MYSCSSAFFFSLPILLLWLSSADASHFRFGSVAWFPTPGYSSNTVTFTFHLAFRRSFSNSYYCDETTKSQRALIGYGDSWRATCSLNPQCSTIYLADTGFYCTDYSVTEDWSMGENNFTYTFPSYNSIWTLSYTSCCWISSLSRYANSQWLVSGEIDLSPRSDNGKINSSPVTRSLAIIRFQEGCPKEIRIPVEDPDGDTVKCRWASVAESSIASDSFPYGTLNEITCVLKYEGGNGTAGTYAVTLTLEDFPAGTTNFNSVRPFSAVGLQFLVIITGQLGLCNDVPVFTDSTPKDGECSEIQIGSAYTAVIEVQLAYFAKHVVEITTSSPPGMQITALQYHQGIYYRNVTWYPSQYQFGQNLFCFQAVDSSGLQSSLHCITILVGLSNTPQVILGSQRPMYPKSELGPGLLWWSVQFDRVIKKPRSSAYIRLVLLPSGYTVYKVDTLSQHAVIDSNRTVLHFATPKAALSMNGSYAILIDHGAIVGQGCSYDGPPSPGITSVSDWGFPVNGVCPVGFSLAPPGFTNCVDVDECDSQSRSNGSSWSWFNPSSSPTTAYGVLPFQCEGPCLLISTTTEIVTLDFDNATSNPVITGISRGVSLDVHFSLGYIFWTDVTEKKIKRSCIDGTNITVINDKIGVCEGLAVDWKSSQLYWTDTTSNTISVSDLEGNNTRILVSLSLDKPRGIVLDPEQGLMFWTDWGVTTKIEKSTLNGTQRVTMVTSNLQWPNGITLDRQGRHVFWVDAGTDRVESIDYHGNNRKLLYQNNGLHFFGVTFLSPYLFVSDWANKGVFKLNASSGVNKGWVFFSGIDKVMGIVPYDSSWQLSVNAIHPTPASEIPSSLYLPSDCEQICSNTLGSYTCSCVSGYQLAPDGKSCSDADECSINNGGCSHACFNIPGSFYCGCPEGRTMGANNLTCVEPGVSVSCGDSNMTVSLEKRTFPFFEVSQLHLRYSSCRATENDTHLLISTTLNGCGTLVNETEDALIFWNEIQADAVIIDYVITRTHDIKLPFYCSYSRRKLLSLSFTPQPVSILIERGYGNLTFRIDFYTSSSFDTPYSLQDYPLEVELNQYIYVRYSVEANADLAIMAVTCKATKDGSFYSWPQYTIIQNGCPRDTTMDYSFDTSRSYQEFKVKTFRFFNDYETVYLHCELLACHRYSPNSRCSQGCSVNKRKKRDVTRDEIEHEESTSKVILTQGPLVFKKEEQKSGETEQNKQNGALIGGTAAAGGFGLIAIVALAVLFVKYRIARRFMNRNKVGDLYTTQDEQLSRRNAYIQEDDMIEKEDAF